MKRFLYFLLLTAVTFAAGCSDYDDSELGGRIDGFKERIARLQSRIASLNEQLADLSELTSGNVITAMTQDSEGNCVITYKDNKDEEKSVVLATVDQMLNVPLLGVEPDAESGLYYWTVTADGQTAPLLDKDGERVPVSGHTPVVSVDEQGFWTVNGERLNDAAGRPIEANDGESCLFREIARDANGNLSLTLGNGEVITLPIQQVLNLTLSTAINTTVVDTSAPMTVKYTLHGEHAADALVGIAAAEGVEAALDKEQQQIVVTFPAGFSAGHLIAVAYDMMEHTVLRPVFFAKAASDRIEIRTAAELVQFAADVNAGTGAQLMTAVLMNDIDLKDVAQWTPIGNGTFAATTAVSTPSGAAFEGTFDGQGYALRNLKMEAALTGDNQAYGLFGVLKGATVKNLVLGAENGDTGSFKVSGNGVTSTGVIAGASVESTIEECTSYLPMECLGNGASNKLMTMGLVGFVYGAGTSDETVTKLIGLKNYGAMKAVPGAANTNGFTSTQAGCIAGVSNTSRTSTFRNLITRCANYGDMTVSTGRASGIVAAANTFTVVSECENHGDMLNTYGESGGGRLGNITCILGTSSVVDGCTNYGDIVATNAKTHAGGLVCLTNSADSEVVNSANYGNVITDLATYRGTLVANINNGAKLDNNTAGGATGYHIAGIVGFSSNDGSSQQKVIISDCINYGDMTSATGRTSGIVAAANRYTQLTNCVNHGDQMNTCPKEDAGRLGNITCNMGTGSSMSGCTNYGNLTSTTGARCGGITSISNTATFENCANYGTILSDGSRGVFWAYNNGVAQWTDCTAGGKVGTYNNGAPVFDSYAEADQANYLGKQGSNKSTLTNIVYQIGSTGGGGTGGDAELRILFIGNSFTKDAVEHLPGILKAAGLDKVKMTHMYYGGRTVPEYNNGFATVNDYRCYECGPGAAGWTELMNKTIKEVAASDRWDIVTIQEHTGKVNAWSWTSTEKEALQGLIDNVKSTQTGAMPKFYYILSQAYGDPAIVSYSQQTVIVNNFASSQADMYAAIVAQGKKVMAEVSFDDVIATGTVLQNLRTSKLQNSMDMTRDGYHMDYGIARYAASCAVFEKLISPAFGGVTLNGNTFRYTTSNSTAGSYSTPVTDANAPIALQAARYALATPYAVTDMSDIDKEKPDNGIEDTEFDDDKNKE